MFAGRSKVFRTTLTSVCVFFAYFASAPFITPYLISKGFAKDEISYALAFAPFFLIFLSAIIGQVSDVIGRKKMIGFSLIMMVTAYFLYINITKDIFSLIVAAALMTVAYYIFLNTSISRIEDNIDQERRGRSTGKYETLKSLGMMSGSFFGTYIVFMTDMTSVLKLSLVMITIIFVTTLLRKGHNHNRVGLKDFNFARDIRTYLSIKGLAGITVLGVAMNFAQAATIIFIPLLITQELGASLSYVGMYAAIISATHLTQYFWGKRFDRTSKRKIILISALFLSMGYGLLMFANSPIFILGAAVVIGLAGSAWNVSALSYIGSKGKEHKNEGLVIGSYSSLANVGVALGYVVSGYLSVAVDTRFVFMIYGLVGVTAVLIARKLVTD